MDPLLTQLAASLTGAEDLEGMTRPILALLQQVTGLESTYLTRVDEAEGQQHIQFSRNSRTLRIPEGLSVPWGDTLCKRALDEGQPCASDVAERWGDSQAARELGIRTYMSQPVRHGDGQLYGTLCAASATSVPVSEQAMKVLGMFARLIEMQVDREQLVGTLRVDNARLASRASTDPLTGIANRRALIEALDRSLARAKREDVPVHVAFIDLDGFKGINDRHGHETGDAFLRQIAERLKTGTRMQEMVGRYGGDEFVLVAEGARGEELKERLEALIPGRYALGTVTLDYPGASIGIVQADSARESAEQLLARADAAMYETKKARKAGRT